MIDCRGKAAIKSQIMYEFIVVFVTAGSSAEGERLARVLVEERLAACVNRIAAVQSVYRWEGKVEERTEELLIIKARGRMLWLWKKGCERAAQLCRSRIIALPIINGSENYLTWLREQVLAMPPTG